MAIPKIVKAKVSIRIATAKVTLPTGEVKDWETSDVKNADALLRGYCDALNAENDGITVTKASFLIRAQDVIDLGERLARDEDTTPNNFDTAI